METILSLMKVMFAKRFKNCLNHDYQDFDDGHDHSIFKPSTLILTSSRSFHPANQGSDNLVCVYKVVCWFRMFIFEACKIK